METVLGAIDEARQAWQDPGPVVLVVCLLVGTVGLLLIRASSRTGQLRPGPPAARLTPWQMAVFHRDRVTMMGTCLAELFAAGVLDRAGRLVGPGTDPRPGSIRISPAAVALRDHLASGAPAISANQFVLLPAVSREIEATRQLLAEGGLLVPNRLAIRGLRLFAAAVLIAGSTIALAGVMLTNGATRGGLSVALLAYLPLGVRWLPRRPMAATEGGGQVVAAIRARHARFDPRQGGQLTAAGDAIPMVVASFGIGALCAEVPALSSVVAQLPSVALSCLDPGAAPCRMRRLDTRP